MTLLIVSFIAGILTATAPCMLTLLPVIIGSSVARSGTSATEQRKLWYRPIIIVGSLALSIIIFTLILKASTTFLGVPQITWQIISGTIIILLGIHFIKPDIWKNIPYINRFNIGSNKYLGKSYSQNNFGGDVLVGAALGPVFNSCSPTYALIVAAILPVTFIQGVGYLLAYVAGLSTILLLIAYLGQSVVVKLRWLSDPNALFFKILGIIFILVGVGIIFGFDKDFQTYVLEQGWYDSIINLEQNIR